jgi:hypothetical protein
MGLFKDIEKSLKRLTESVDDVSDKEAKSKFKDLEDKDLDNDGDTDSSDKYLHKRLGKVALKTEEESEEELDEMSTTAATPGYMTPKAFGTADDDTVEADGWKRVKKTNKIFRPMENKSSYKKMMSEMYGIQSEAVSYREYKKDESASPSQKVNKGIMEVNKMLAEIEKIVHNNIRLKTETGVDSSHFWKQTSSRINKINERIVRISNRLKELSK